MAEPVRLLVWTPSETVVDQEGLEWVHLELVGDRSVTIWPGHAPLLAETAADAVRYSDGSGMHAVDLPSGIVFVQDDTVTVFLAGTLDEQVWQEEETPARFERLAQTMAGALQPGSDRV